MKHLLSHYVRLVIESMTSNARVPSQLVDVDDQSDEESDVNEFSGVGAIAGFTAPLGMSANDLNNGKRKTKRLTGH